MKSESEMEEGEFKCPRCLGTGKGVTKHKHLGVDVCIKCKGKGTIDWIENIMGVKGTYIEPGVYIRGVDFSVPIQTNEYAISIKDVVS